MSSNEILLGCDPEVFLVDSEGNPVSAHGMIPGTKEEPHLVDCGMVQVDGMALEFGIDPSPNYKTFLFNIRSVMRQLQEMIPKGYSILIEPVVVFPKEIIDKQPAEALMLGCDPDYNGYTGRVNEAPVLPDPNMRSAGGHVHIGFGKDLPVFSPEHLADCSALAVQLDKFLGIPSIAWDSNTTRRLIYGAPGAFRPKSYGMEYRTLSNKWIAKEETIRIVYNQTIKAVEQLDKGELDIFVGKRREVKIREIILKSDKNIANDYMRELSYNV